jgi:hypothetical protein
MAKRIISNFLLCIKFFERSKNESIVEVAICSILGFWISNSILLPHLSIIYRFVKNLIHKINGSNHQEALSFSSICVFFGLLIWYMSMSSKTKGLDWNRKEILDPR